jgi:hypothetical protein
MAAMSQRQYAAHRGVARSAVQRAIRDQRITTLPDGRIDPDLADGQWEERTIQPAGDGGGSAEFVRARAVKMHYDARIAKLLYEEKVRTLISADEVRVAAFNTYRRFRDGMLNLPDRLAAIIAAESDSNKVHGLLAVEIRQALSDFADGPIPPIGP